MDQHFALEPESLANAAYNAEADGQASEAFETGTALLASFFARRVS